MMKEVLLAQYEATLNELKEIIAIHEELLRNYKNREITNSITKSLEDELARNIGQSFVIERRIENLEREIEDSEEEA